MSASLPKLAIFSGGGSLPVGIAQSARKKGQQVYMLGLAGEAAPEIEAFPHAWVKWGEIGRIFKILEEENCKQILMVGRVSRPELTHIRLDLGAFALLPKLLKFLSGGDDSLLRKIISIFEDKGIEVVGVGQVAPEFLAPVGTLTQAGPTQSLQEDIYKGVAAIHALSPLDVGQAVVVSRQHILAVEAVEGTDRMLERCVGLRQWFSANRSGVLVKLPKTGQEMRIDIPAIGPKTIEKVAEAKLQGIVVAAGGALLAEKDELIRQAREKKIFVYGLSPKELEQARNWQPS